MSSDLPKVTTYELTIGLMGTREPDMRYQLYRRLKDSVGGFSPDNWWQYREATRFILGPYKPILPFDNEWFGNVTMHRAFLATFPHIAEDPSLVSWVPDSLYGIQDKRVVGKPGKLLQSYMGFDEATTARFVNRFNAEQRALELKFTENIEEIYTVYSSGPTSCMTKGFNKDANPLKVYDVPTLCVAYALDRGRIVARTVVRKDRTPWEYTRIYGNEFALINLFEKQGMRRSHDGLEGIVLGEPIQAPSISRLYIAYLDSPCQHLLLDWEEHTIKVTHERPTKGTQQQLVANNADGLVALAPHIFQAWMTGKMIDPVTKKKVTPYDRFWGRYTLDEDEGTHVMCVDCEDFYHPDECEPSWQGYPICTSCCEENYRWAVMNNAGRREWVYHEYDGLIYVECVDDYCCSVDPTSVFDIVENVHGEYMVSDEAVHSTLQEGYIQARSAREIYRLAMEEDGDEDWEHSTHYYRDRVEENWLDRRSEHVFLISDIRIRKAFSTRVYYLEERTAHGIEEVGAQVAEEVGAARRSILVERPQEFAERLATLARSAESARDRTHLLTGIPGFILALVRSRLAENERAAGNAQPRSAA